MATEAGWFRYGVTTNKTANVAPTSGSVTTTGDFTLTVNETFTFGGVTYTYNGTQTVGNGSNLVNGFSATSGGVTYFFAEVNTALNRNTAPVNAQQIVICFMPGTLIRTPDGDVAVEALKIGDLVVTTTGAAAPVRWIGRQTVSTVFADPLRTLPIRIKAGALGNGLPLRDLLVSPGHAMLVDDVLIQAGALVNGTSILHEQDVPKVFTYYHVELTDHALILAEGAPTETFIDNIERENFDNWAEHEALYDPAPITEMALPRAKSHRQVPMATRHRLAEVAASLQAKTANAA